MSAGIICTPDNLLNGTNTNCLKCLSKHELLAVISVALCNIESQSPSTDCTASTLANASVEFNRFSDKQLLEAITAILIQFGIGQGYIVDYTTTTENAKCLACLNENQLKAIILSKLCSGISAGTLFCDERQPT